MTYKPDIYITLEIYRNNPWRPRPTVNSSHRQLIKNGFSITVNKHTTHNSSNRSDEGLTFETTAFELFTVANLRYQLSSLLIILNYPVIVSLETYPLY